MKMRGSQLCAELALACGAMVLAAVPATAQDTFPSHPIQLVVAQAPRGGADLHARPLAQAMERILRQPVVVVNKPGAGSVMGTQFVVNSRADGYTLLVAMPGFLINPQVDILFERPPKFNPEQFTPIARLSAEPLVLVVHPARPWKSVSELVADAKRRPGDIAYGSSGIYTGSHFPMEIFASAAGITLKHVPYNGTGPAVIGLLGGHVDALATNTGPVLAHIKAGKLRALATWGARRLAPLPDVPTLKEIGLDVEYYVQVGIVARRETPVPALKILREAVKQAVRDPEFEAAMALLGTTVSYLDAGEYQDVWAKDSKSIAQILQRIGKIE